MPGDGKILFSKILGQLCGALRGLPGDGAETQERLCLK